MSDFSTTDSGVRKVKIRGAVRKELKAVLERRKADQNEQLDQNAYLFPTSTGKLMGPDNFRNRFPAWRSSERTRTWRRRGKRCSRKD